jgi:hypothetical protein
LLDLLRFSGPENKTVTQRLFLSFSNNTRCGEPAMGERDSGDFAAVCNSAFACTPNTKSGDEFLKLQTGVSPRMRLPAHNTFISPHFVRSQRIFDGVEQNRPRRVFRNRNFACGNRTSLNLQLELHLLHLLEKNLSEKKREKKKKKKKKMRKKKCKNCQKREGFCNNPTFLFLTFAKSVGKKNYTAPKILFVPNGARETPFALGRAIQSLGF